MTITTKSFTIRLWSIFFDRRISVWFWAGIWIWTEYWQNPVIAGKVLLTDDSRCRWVLLNVTSDKDKSAWNLYEHQGQFSLIQNRQSQNTFRTCRHSVQSVTYNFFDGRIWIQILFAKGIFYECKYE